MSKIDTKFISEMHPLPIANRILIHITITLMTMVGPKIVARQRVCSDRLDRGDKQRPVPLIFNGASNFNSVNCTVWYCK